MNSGTAMRTEGFSFFTLIREEIVGEDVDVAVESVHFEEFVVVVIGHDDVFGIARHVDDLRGAANQKTNQKRLPTN